ncbi:MAG: hypothetical protein ACI89E_000298, partial [Planctomycetota bacterium]
SAGMEGRFLAKSSMPDTLLDRGQHFHPILAHIH